MTDLKAQAATLGGGSQARSVLIASTDPSQAQLWPIRDRKPLKHGPRGRITLAGDAAHAMSPYAAYAAYGTGISIGDGYTIAQCLASVDLNGAKDVVTALQRYDQRRICHTTMQVQQACILGKVFHHVPAPLCPIRDFVLGHTKWLQKRVGERSPGETVAQLEETGAGLTQHGAT